MLYKHLFQCLFFFIIFTITCCTNDSPQQPPILKAYIQALNESNIPALASQVTDSITITEGEFVIVKNKTQFRTHCRWDSTFQPYYELLGTKITSNRIEAVLAKKCQRIDFLHDSAIVYKISIQLQNSKIAQISTLDYVNFNFPKWQSRRDSLTAWINDNHPNLSGCINDQTPIGASRYLTAIKLYQTAELETHK